MFGMEWDHDRGELLLRRRVPGTGLPSSLAGDGYVTAWCPIFDVGPIRGYYQRGPRPVTVA